MIETISKEPSDLIQMMIDTAKKAGQSLMEDFGNLHEVKVSLKAKGDFVSSADHRTEKLIMQHLMKATPSYSFLMEEQGAVCGIDKENLWIVDPLDGTSNFIHGIPHFCVSIALKRQNTIVAGVIFYPALNYLYWAEKGKGSYFNHKKMQVSKQLCVDDVLMTIDIPYSDNATVNTWNCLKEKIGSTRHFGSAALDLAYVASGKLDAAFATNLKPWDLAAGILLVQESGGIVCDANGKQEMLATGTILAANSHVFAPLSKLLLGSTTQYFASTPHSTSLRSVSCGAAALKAAAAAGHGSDQSVIAPHETERSDVECGVASS